MSLNAAALRLLAEKGLTAADIVELAETLEVRRDPTAAERMRRHRAKKAEASGKPVTRNVTAERDERDPPNDIYSNPPVPPSAKADSPPSEKIVEAWNAGPAKAGATASRGLTASLKSLLRARIKENGADGVLEAIRNLAASKFHCGENDRGWKANLGWMLKAENFQKMLELTPAKPSSLASIKPLPVDDDRELRELFRASQSGEITTSEFDERRAEILSRQAKPPPRLTAQHRAHGAAIGDLVGRLAAVSH